MSTGMACNRQGKKTAITWQTSEKENISSNEKYVGMAWTRHEKLLTLYLILYSLWTLPMAGDMLL